MTGQVCIRAVAAAIALAAGTGIASAQTPSFKPTIEQDTARPGEDYHHFTSDPMAASCQLACTVDTQCRAWEYDGSRPNDPICWLKNKVPPAQKLVGHVAGIVRPDGPPPPDPPQLVQLAIRSSAQAAKQCLDVADGKFTQGARLRLWDCNTSSSQLFLYDVTSEHLMIGGSCVQVAGTGQQGGAVVLGACSVEATRTWNIDLKQDHAQLTNANGFCLDVAGGKLDNGAPIQVWACNGSAGQLWGFTRVKTP